MRTFLLTIADTHIKKNATVEIFEIEGKKILFYPSTGTLSFITPLPPLVKTMLINIFTENLVFPQIGTDESGKGDLFGPLVIAGVLIEKKDIPELIDIGIKDSKKISNIGLNKLKTIIERKFMHSVILITPRKYNELHSKLKSVNKILGWAHARAIENLLKEKNANLIIIDMFANPEFIRSYMFHKAREKEFIIEKGAEKHLSSALASVIARIHYIDYIKKMEHKYQMRFPKGAGDIVNKAAIEFINKYGKELLPHVAKMHFKNIKNL